MNFRFFAFGMSALFGLVVCMVILTMVGSQFLTKDQLSVLIEPTFFFGFVIVGSRKLPDVLSRCLMLIPAALLAALVFNSSFTSGQSYALDERAIGLGVAIIAAWRKLPLIVVVILGAATTAFLRAL